MEVMPDENKFEKLRDVGFRVTVTCAICTYGCFQGTSLWGECWKHRYYHKKHSNQTEGRGVSIFSSGTCPDAELDPRWRSQLGAHTEFLNEDDR